MSKTGMGFRTWLAVAAGFVVVGDVRAQEEVKESSSSGASIVVSSSSDEGGGAQMQVMGYSSDGGVMNFVAPLEFTPGMMFGGDPFMMLSNSSVQSELDLVGDQLDRYQQLQKDYSQRMKDEIEKLTKSGGIKEAGRLPELIKEIERQKKEDIEKILLPHQLERLEQISLQNRLRTMGAAGTLADEAVREKLGLSKDDVKKLQERSKELNTKLQEQIQKLREQMQDELLEVLQPEQREKLKSMVGDKFQLKDETPLKGLRARRATEEKEKNN